MENCVLWGSTSTMTQDAASAKMILMFMTFNDPTELCNNLLSAAPSYLNNLKQGYASGTYLGDEAFALSKNGNGSVTDGYAGPGAWKTSQYDEEARVGNLWQYALHEAMHALCDNDPAVCGLNPEEPHDEETISGLVDSCLEGET